MNSLKLVATVIVAVLVVAFLIYKTKWRTNNVTTDDVIGQESLDAGEGESYDDHRLYGIADGIDANSENEIVSSYKATEGLRELLLNKHINASDLVKNEYLIPKGLDFNKACERAKNVETGGLLKMMDTETSQPHGKINDKTTFTDMPNFFGVQNNSIPGADSWGKIH